MVKSVTVRAPCSTANLGPGFDVFGMALDAFYDEVTVTKKPKSFGIKIVSSDDIPLDPKKNTAGLVAAAIKKDFGIENGLEIKIKKKVPAGYGMGSSAASASACAICMESLFDIMEEGDLLDYAGIGEKASAGTVHYDNVAASLYGGFVVVNSLGDEVDYLRFAPPKNLSFVVAIPKIKVPKQKTKASRGLIPKNVKFSDACTNLASAVSMVAHLADGDGETAAMRLRDVIVEPARKKMIPGFDKVKENALKAGAAACTISGAGPSVIAFVGGCGKIIEKQKVKIGEAMKKGFKSAKTDCEIIICKPSKGPKIVKVVK